MMMRLFFRPGESREPLAGVCRVATRAALHKTGVMEYGQFGVMGCGSGSESFCPLMKIGIESFEAIG